MAEVRFENVSKHFGSVKVIEKLNLTIADGKFTVLVGPSGCGKTTLLRMIAGIGPASSGKVLLDGEDITDVPPGKRSVSMVFQNYAIYPTMTVRENIEFGLKNNRVPKAERNRRIEAVSVTVGLDGLLARKPNQLSGGQRQRVALARAMVKEPKVFLMDEPLSNLDAKLRTAMRSELIQLHKQLETTFVYVTHDQVEAMAMADVIVLMHDGEIMQEDSPEKLYHDPDNVFAAQFIGTPTMNILPVHDQAYLLGYRPENVTLSPDKPDDYAYLRYGRILTREMLGAETIYKVDLGQETIMVKSSDSQVKIGDDTWVSVAEDSLLLFDKENSERVRRGDNPHYESILAAVRS
ncbi:MAG TPA: ABC transporter ATP-binding protein [Clostridiaceae bacterium]|nr:ABC transporter ATP-binding protein [Clostridiaceae bacterium]